MDSIPMTTQKAIVVIGMLFLLIGMTLVVPASSVGLPVRHQAPLVLKNFNDYSELAQDKDRNNIPDWKDLVTGTISSTTQTVTLDETTKKRLNDPNNLTSSFSKNVYIAAAYSEKNGEMTDEEKSSLINSLLEEEAKKIIIQSYTENDLRVTKKEDDTSRREYGNTLGTLVRKADTYKLTSNDLAIIEAFNVKQDESVLASLVIKNNNITLILNELLSMNVPVSAVPYHLLLVNRVSNFKSVIENLAEAKNDPIRASVALHAYNDSAVSLLSSLRRMSDYFSIMNTTFSTKDPGVVFITGYTK